jgi:hypothetical protein
MAGLFGWMVFALPPAMVEIIYVVLGFWGEWTDDWQAYQWWQEFNGGDGFNIVSAYDWLAFLGVLAGLYYGRFRRRPADPRRFGFLFLAACLFYGETIVIGNDLLSRGFLPVLGAAASLFYSSFFRNPIGWRQFGLGLFACLFCVKMVAAENGLLADVCLPFLGVLSGLYYSGFRQDLPRGRRFGVLFVLAALVYGGLAMIGFISSLIFIFLTGKMELNGDNWQLHG